MEISECYRTAQRTSCVFIYFLFQPTGNIFKCEQGDFIAYTYVCNGNYDCPADLPFDETGYICKVNSLLTNECKYVVNKNIFKTCSSHDLTLPYGICLLLICLK